MVPGPYMHGAALYAHPAVTQPVQCCGDLSFVNRSVAVQDVLCWACQSIHACDSFC